MRQHDAIDGPTGQPEPEGHKWVAGFLHAPPDDGEYSFEDFHMLDYVPDDADPAAAFNGLKAEAKENLTRNGQEKPNIERITLALYDEESAMALAIGDAIRANVEPEWTFKKQYKLNSGGVPFDDAAEDFQRVVGQQSGPSVQPEE